MVQRMVSLATCIPLFCHLGFLALHLTRDVVLVTDVFGWQYVHSASAFYTSIAAGGIV